MTSKKEEKSEITETFYEDEDVTKNNLNKRDSGGEKQINEINPRDLIDPEHMNPEKLGDIVVYSNRADVMTEEDEKKFEQCMRDFAKKFVYKKSDAELSEDEFLAFYVSLVQCWLTQSTSMKNARQRNLSNSLMIKGQKYVWRTSEFIDFIKGNLPHVPNPFRQYARNHEHEIEILKATGKVRSDHHLQAKHGVLSQYWNIPADYVNGAMINISDDDLAANLLMKCQALKGSSQDKKYYNVSQLAPGGCSK
ncbi:CP [Bean yellow disorder virus]|uniref:CP n=1 Tax=Bean yellow disorder virus TaxID=267970 RepID=B2BZX0_9CLOS|nr:CP [Bean yellow disorder virus]ABY66969.1 CP [Bean yellow disorder virus]